MGYFTPARDIPKGSVVLLPHLQTAGYEHIKEFTIDQVKLDFPEHGLITWYDHLQLLSLELEASIKVEVIRRP